MPRMIDDLRTRGHFAMPIWVSESKQKSWMDYALHVAPLLQEPSLPVVLVDNVAEYYFGSEQEYWNLKEDFPNLAPPYERWWMEHRLPPKIHSKEKGDSDLAGLIGTKGRVGALFTTLDPKAVPSNIPIPPEARWAVWAEMWIDYGQGEIQGPHGATFFLIDAEGKLLAVPAMQAYCDDDVVHYMKSLITWFHPSLLAVSFLHCKNVTLVENKMDLPLAKKFHARHQIWPAKYSTLIIEPLKKILKTQGRSGEVGLQKAIHICRGHFRDYREGRGLFGKYKQLVWMPSIVRGGKGTGEKAPPREVEIKL